MSLANKRVVVIGGTSGIGFAVAQAALGEGADVTVASSRKNVVDGALARLGKAEGHVVDVRDEAQLGAMFARIGKFDHLAFTAGDWGGAMLGGSLETLDLAKAAGVFAVRYWGALAAVKQAYKYINADGSVTLTDGMVAHRPRKGAAVNSSMAGAVEHLTRALAVDLAPIRVNAVCPGIVATEVWNSIADEQRAERMRRMVERQPLRRVGEPAELAEAYLYLMRCGYTTGQVLHVDGGLSVV